MPKKSIPVEPSIVIPISLLEKIKAAVEGGLIEMQSLLESIKTSAMYRAVTRMSYAMSELLDVTENQQKNALPVKSTGRGKGSRRGKKSVRQMNFASAKTAQTIPNGYLSINQIAKKTRVSRTTVYARLASIKTDPVRVGRSLYFPENAYEKTNDAA
jgi:DNA invertase Pin-like site-specific DNA recombinase